MSDMGRHIAMLRDRARAISVKDHSGRNNTLRAAIEEQREDEMPENDYPYVRAWEKMMSAGSGHAAKRLEQARKDGAPQDATYPREDGTWNTTADIVSQDTRRYLGLDPLPPTAPAVLANYHAEILSQVRAEGLDNFEYEITFPSMRSASRWTSEYKITKQVFMKAGDRFDLPVTVIYDTWED